MNEVVAVIPARAGSRRIPGKNTKSFLGVPSLARAIETTRRAGVFDAIFVSTDSSAIADMARECGALVPELRPASLADDYTPTRPVILHAIQHWLEASVEIVACVYAVTPLLRAELLRNGVSLAASSGGYVFPVEKSRHPVQRAIELDHQGLSFSREPNDFFSRSQDLPSTYFDVGQFYIARREVWLERERFHDGGTTIQIEPGSVVDIDTSTDWGEAERLFQLNARPRESET